MNYLDLESLDSYRISLNLSNEIWDEVLTWDKFSRLTIGQQLVRSIDSVSANIAEGFGRYHKKDKVKFYRYSFGSIKETQDWINKAKYRKLMSPDKIQSIESNLNQLPQSLYHLIKFTNEKLKF